MLKAAREMLMSEQVVCVSFANSGYFFFFFFFTRCSVTSRRLRDTRYPANARALDTGSVRGIFAAGVPLPAADCSSSSSSSSSRITWCEQEERAPRFLRGIAVASLSLSVLNRIFDALQHIDKIVTRGKRRKDWKKIT